MPHAISNYFNKINLDMIKIHYERLKKAQELMKKNGMVGIMIMNHDDFRYFFGDIRVQPRAIIPASGSPIFVVFSAEEEEIRSQVKNEEIKIFSHVGEQISDVRNVFHSLFDGPPPGITPPPDGKLRIGMQMWFHTPAFLVDLFRKVNPQAELVPSDPVMDALRMVKDPEEIQLMKKAQSIAASRMARAKELLRPGVTGHEIATEVLYTMMKNGAEGTSTPVHINAGKQSCWIHGKVSKDPIKAGDLVVIDLTPQYDGYCANLARTFMVGRKPDEIQQKLIDTYIDIHESTRKELKPGVTVSDLDKIGKEICTGNGLEQYHLKGISHGIGLRFEENPASTIIPAHSRTKLDENMTVTIGHTILAIPGVGGVRFEDVCRVTKDGGEILHSFPFEYFIH
jgi:Xaa-Pro dipeptidase